VQGVAGKDRWQVLQQLRLAWTFPVPGHREPGGCLAYGAQIEHAIEVIEPRRLVAQVRQWRASDRIN
jgi:hypothetical protein